ncbi:HNH endonuclease signature motif containing protein [Nocardia heshunensis]
MNSKGETLDNCGTIALVAAVQDFSNAVLHGNLATLSDAEFVDMLRDLEACKRQLSALDSQLVIGIGERGLAQSSGAGSLKEFMRQTLGLSRYDAAQRVKIAEACGEFLSGNGTPRPITLSATAEAYEAGAISQNHVRNIVDVMKHLPADIAPEAYAETEQHLVEHSLTGAPDDLPKMGREILARLDPEGTVISDADRRRRRGITIARPGVDGMSKIDGWLTPELRAYLDAFLAKYARPGMCNLDDAEPLALSVTSIDSKVLDDAARRDRRDAGQRTHDALYALLQPAAPAVAGKRATAATGVPADSVASCGVPAASCGVPAGLAGVVGESAAPATVIGESVATAAGFGQHRGLKTQVILTMSLADLERGAGVASTATGGHVSINEALKMAAGTRPVLAVLDPQGIPLFLGKSQRLASPGQRLALIARDKGCTRPGCDAPASMCAAHHITDWAEGGPTDLSNLALACDHCHALVNDSADGWKTVVMGKDSGFSGRCGWIAPKHVDPSGTAKVNQRHHVAGLVAAAVDSSCQQWGSRVA